MKNTIKNLRKNKAFTLIELVMSLGVMIILLTLLTQIMVTLMRQALVNKERTFVREETANMLTVIRKDLRNAGAVSYCNGDLCVFTQNGNLYAWAAYPDTTISTPTSIYYLFSKATLDQNEMQNDNVTIDQITSISIASNYGTGNPNVGVFTSSDEVRLMSNAVFTKVNATGDGEKATIIINLKSCSKPRPGSTPFITNVLKQSTISLKNYDF